MQPSFIYRPELHLAAVAENNSKIGKPIRVVTLLQCPGKPQAAINAYLAARYSRSDLSVEQIAEEVYARGDEAAANSLSNIFHGYGHASVGDQASLTVCIENVTQFTAHKIFNMLPVKAGQERSTRYQKFDGENFGFAHVPSHWPVQIRERYVELMQQWIEFYKEFQEPTKQQLMQQFSLFTPNAKEEKTLEARTLDCTRYFIPLGSKTSLAIIASARTFSTLIAQLKGSNQIESRKVGLLIELLLSKSVDLTEEGSDLFHSIDDDSYIPEAGTLIRHVEPNSSIRETTAELIQELVGEDKDARHLNPFIHNKVEQDFTLNNGLMEQRLLLKHLYALRYPKVTYQFWSITLNGKSVFKVLGEILFKRHNRHNPIGNLAQTGAIAIEGVADIGTLRDLNRHSSFERFLPYLDDCYDIEADVLSGNLNTYGICPYLQLGECYELGEQYKDALSKGYRDIRRWYVEAVKTGGLPLEEVLEFTRYLLPLAHLGHYFFYASVDDMQYVADLRTRPGGHIQYRLLVKNWIKALVDKGELHHDFWKPLYDKLPSVDASSVDEFLDRS